MFGRKKTLDPAAREKLLAEGLAATRLMDLYLKDGTIWFEHTGMDLPEAVSRLAEALTAKVRAAGVTDEEATAYVHAHYSECSRYAA